ncbi:MAG: TolC family protein [Rikenellaceae bacterium]|jgi:cobalt-zinc-cadmium efflux system outer membrane protein|nr:TolC family protein [Rikenellaceae bacterium]
MKKLTNLLAAILILVAMPLNGQVHLNLTLNEFLSKIQTSNLEYVAEKLNMDIADAQIISASVFNNPSLGLSYYNNELKSMQMGQGAFAEVSQTFSPGRRPAAINIAKSEKELTSALLTDYLRVLRQDAVNLWLEVVKMRQLYQIKKESYNDQLALMESDSLSRGAEYNRDLDILQNRVETGILYSEILDMGNELKNLYISITGLCGVNVSDTLFIPEKRNIFNDKAYNLETLMGKALENRSDIVAARKETDVSKYLLKAAKVERIPEFDIFLGYGINAEVRNELAPAPKFGCFEVGVSFPIPLFNRNKGGISAAQSELKQSELRYIAAQNQVRNELIQAFNNFNHTTKKLNLFKAGLVKSAKDALDQKRGEYYRGEIHLIEVLDAQRSYDEILASFYSAIYDKSQALVALESAAGVWDIE